MNQRIKSRVKALYGAAARASRARATGSCCDEDSGRAASGCCGPVCAPTMADGLYGAEQLRHLPGGSAELALGCGNPTAMVTLIPGETVLDLGSGSGTDAFLAARRVGPTGKVYGLDLTPDMVATARERAAEAGFTNVEFLLGDIEDIPLPDETVDVAISNCVINLAANKDRVFGEVLRVLRPGGRLAVADTVFLGDVSLVPRALREDPVAWCQCVAGALGEEEYVAKLTRTGFTGVSLTVTHAYDPSPTSCCGSAAAPTGLPEGVRLASAFVRAWKPGQGPFVLRGATPADLDAVRRLLSEAGLPQVGLEEQFASGFAVAVWGSRVIGAAGLEVHGRDGLLRSVVAENGWRGQGVGSALVRDRLGRARDLGLESIWLLTSTAAPYFARFGFARAERSAAPDALRRTVEFAEACPAGATAMRLGAFPGAC